MTRCDELAAMLYVLICAAELVVLLLFGSPITVDALGHTLPSRFPRCKKADLNTKRCEDNKLDKSLHLLRDGIPELGIPSIDPLELTAIEVGESGGPVSLGGKFTNVIVKGLTNAKFFNARFNFDDKTNMSILFSGKSEELTFESDYEMTGRMLLVPLSGNGRCKLRYEKINATLGPGGNMITVKGKEYFNVTNFLLDIHNIDKIDFNLDNLFNGDKNLGSPTLQLINENWKQVWGELLPVFVEVFGNLYVQLAKRVFDRVPFDDVFLD